MIDHTYRIRLTTGMILHIAASTVSIEGDQLAFVGAKGNLSALFLAELVSSWTMLPNVATGETMPLLDSASEIIHHRPIDGTPSKAVAYRLQGRRCRPRRL
jgi:hypothetical protein